MKFTQEDLLNALKLKVGDKIIVHEIIYEICKVDKIEYYLKPVRRNAVNETDIFRIHFPLALGYLIGNEFEIVKEKHVGDLTCDEIRNADKCEICPLRGLDCCTNPNSNIRESLYKNLKAILLSDESFKDEDLYNFLKHRLDKKVEDFKNE